jgi:hypothetical protein
MANDDRDIVELLKDEIDFIEKGGYGRSVRTPWKAKSAFQDSLTCLNYADPDKSHPCDDCHLIDFVPQEHQQDKIPCHTIPMNAEGDTILELELAENEAKLERRMKDWLRERIIKIEIERMVAATSGTMGMQQNHFAELLSNS